MSPASEQRAAARAITPLGEFNRIPMSSLECSVDIVSAFGLELANINSSSRRWG